MIVTEIKVEGFMGHQKAREVRLPDRGIVVLEGPNGSGKSALIESVATALWGETLRGETPWRTKEPGSVEVVADGIEFRRSVTKAGSKRVEVVTADGEIRHWPTVGKAREEIEGMVGAYEVWKKVSVFSSDDVSRFSTATDAERKRLLEELLGLDRFDLALDRCRAALKQASGVVDRIRADQARLLAVAEGRRARLEDARAVLARVGAVPHTDPVRLAELEDGASELSGAQADARALVSSFHQKTGESRGKLRALEARLAELGDDRCPTCERTMKGAAPLLARLRAEQGALEVQLKDETDALEAAEASFLKITRLIEEDTNSLRGLREAARVAEAAQRQIDSAKATIERLEAELSGGLQAEADADQALAAVESERAELQATEVVLGLRGVRAQVLGRALDGIESLANSHLAKIAIEPDFRIRVRSTSELKSGRTVDTLSVEVEGVGGGHGYRACSTGQRRRIDVALVLAFARVSEYAHARQGGTLFLDEMFDGLDDYGIGAVVEVLVEVARERPVVVVTHNPGLAGRLRPVASRLLEFGA